MYSYKQIRDVHLEITDKCNAACPQCPRNDSGGSAGSFLSLVELSLIDIQTIFPSKFVKQLNHIYACGNYGDSIMAKDTLEIFQYFRNCSDQVMLSMYTNGGARSAEWWKELAKVLKNDNGSVFFGIDGLEDTNHIYRRNTKWPVIMRNVCAFIKAGGYAHWVFIAFRHNEHQITRAKQMANELGFRSFEVKKTNRFANYEDPKYHEHTPIKDRKGKVIDRLKRPIDPELQNKRLGQSSWHNSEEMETIKNCYKSMSDYLDSISINCKAKIDKSIYVSPDGYVLPCCYLATQLYDSRMIYEKRQIMPLLEKIGGLEQINAKRLTIKKIIKNPLFKKYIPESWEKSCFKAGKNHLCARICGKSVK